MVAMKKKTELLFILLLVSAMTVFGRAQSNVEKTAQNLQPKPKYIELKSGSVNLSEKDIVGLVVEDEKSEKAANYFRYLISSRFDKDCEIIDGRTRLNLWNVHFNRIRMNGNLPNSQYYSIKFKENQRNLEVSSPSQLGLLYGAVTLADLLYKEGDDLFIDKLEIEDYPTFERRMFVAITTAENVKELFDFALNNKFETVVLASRQFPWYEVTPEYSAILKEIKNWKDLYGGPKVMQSHNIYEGRDIVISDEADLNALKNVIKVSYEHGIEKLMILSDDMPPFEYDEGYILTDERDKKRFEHFEAANTYLMNHLNIWFIRNKYDIKSYYVPGFYTYEEMHYGDMELFKDTPWEEDAYGPLYRDLKYLGLNMPDNVEIIWTGPFVRSRKITKADIDDWTNNLMGRVPFLWDNTIYSHFPFSSTPMFTAYDNDFPEDFHILTSGSGMFVNGNFAAEDTKATVATVNDYLWDPSTYDPEKSIDIAMAKLYGDELAEEINKYKNTELNLRKTIGERQLFFESDSLWKIIRKIRYIHTKNPFKYHFNYTRMKALRLQLKGSVPEPKPKDDFIDECETIAERREEILERIKEFDKKVYTNLKQLSVELPNFEKID